MPGGPKKPGCCTGPPRFVIAPQSRVTRKGLLWGLRATSVAPVNVDWPDDAL